MPNLPISQLAQSTTLQGNELFVDVQGGITKYTTLDAVTGYVTGSFEYVTPAQTGSLVESAYISVFSTSSQALLVSGSEQAVTFTSTWATQGITLQSGSRLVMSEPGVYQFNFVAQVANAQNAVYDSWFWIKYNGSNFPNSTTKMTLQPRKNVSLPSAQLMTMNIVGVNTVANGYIELYWTGENTSTSLSESPAFGPVPETPSIIADIIRVG